VLGLVCRCPCSFRGLLLALQFHAPPRPLACKGRRGGQLSWHVAGEDHKGVSVSDRDSPSITFRSGTQRARTNPQIRRSGQVVQDRPLRSARWTDIPQLSVRTRLVQRLGNSAGNGHGTLELIHDRPPFRPGNTQVARSLPLLLSPLPLSTQRLDPARWLENTNG
jgi:hypothetical protein